MHEIGHQDVEAHRPSAPLRPERSAHEPLTPHDFSAAESERHSVQPGITGYWQLSGGNELSYTEMVRLDLAYIRHWSLWLDIQLLLRTIPALVHRHGAA